MTDRPDAAPLFRPLGLVIALCLAIIVCWPMYVSGGIFYFFDSSTYFVDGKTIWTKLTGALLPAAETVATVGDGAGPAATEDVVVEDVGGSTVIRSFIYSVFSYVTLTLAGPLGIGIAQATLVIFSFFALIEKQVLASPRVLIAGALGVAALTTLPWYSVYLMPDIFGSIILVFGAVLVTHFNDLSWPKKLVLTVLAALATATHYGNMPLMAGVGGFALLWLLWTRRLTFAAILAVAFATAFSPAVNIAGSSMFLKTTSAAPMRLPILLARSLTDGPALWYLQRECGSVDFAMCEAFGDDIPESIGDLLWDEDGVDSLSAEVRQRIREEELALLGQVFLDYPFAQTKSLLGNSVLQLVRVGTDDIDYARGVTDELEIDPAPASEQFRLGDRGEPVLLAVAAASFLALLALLVTGRMSATQRAMFYVICVGLLVNAAIFGGLSAPVDRYQGRVMWLVPAFLVLVLARLSSEPVSSGAVRQPRPGT